MPNLTVTKTHFTRAGAECTIELPARFEVCERCEGHGHHVNPAIDEHGISPEEFAEDPDFEEGYFSGRYDITCQECGGERLVRVVDEERLTKRQRILWAEIQGVERNNAWEASEERRMRSLGIEF